MPLTYRSRKNLVAASIVLFVVGLALAVMVPWQLHDLFYNPQRVAQWQLSGAFLLVTGLLLRGGVYAQLLVCWQGYRRIVSIAVAALIIAALVFSPMPEVALLEFSYLAMLLGLILVIAAAVPSLDKRGWRFLAAVCAVFILFYSAHSILYVSLVWDFGDRHDFGPGFDNVRFFADVAAGMMPLSLLYIVVRPRPSWLAALFLALPLSVWWWLLWVSESRAALLGLVFGSVVVLVLFGRAARLPVFTLALAGFCGLLGWWLLNPLVVEGAESPFLRDIASSSGRMALWSDALRYAWQQFPLGLGPMGFAADGQYRSAHAHNLLLNIAAEWGLPLALTLLGILVRISWVIRKRVQHLSEKEKPLYTCLVLAFISVMVNVQFAGAQIMPVSALVLVLVIGLAVGFRPGGALPQPSTLDIRPVRATLVWAILMLVFCYQVFAGAALHRLSDAPVSQCVTDGTRLSYYPRFWIQGRVDCMKDIEPDHWLFQRP